MATRCQSPFRTKHLQQGDTVDFTELYLQRSSACLKAGRGAGPSTSRKMRFSQASSATQISFDFPDFSTAPLMMKLFTCSLINPGRILESSVCFRVNSQVTVGFSAPHALCSVAIGEVSEPELVLGWRKHEPRQASQAKWFLAWWEVEVWLRSVLTEHWGCVSARTLGRKSISFCFKVWVSMLKGKLMFEDFVSISLSTPWSCRGRCQSQLGEDPPIQHGLDREGALYSGGFRHRDASCWILAFHWQVHCASRSLQFVLVLLSF